MAKKKKKPYCPPQKKIIADDRQQNWYIQAKSKQIFQIGKCIISRKFYILKD